MATSERERAAFRAGFDAGWSASGEGHNAEYVSVRHYEKHGENWFDQARDAASSRYNGAPFKTCHEQASHIIACVSADLRTLEQITEKLGGEHRAAMDELAGLMANGRRELPGLQLGSGGMVVCPACRAPLLECYENGSGEITERDLHALFSSHRMTCAKVARSSVAHDSDSTAGAAP